MTVLIANYDRKKGCVTITNSLVGILGVYHVRFETLKSIKPTLACSSRDMPISRAEYLKIKNKPTPIGFCDYSGILLPASLSKSDAQKIINALYTHNQISIYVFEKKESHVHPVVSLWLSSPVYLFVDHNKKIRGSTNNTKSGLLLPWDKIKEFCL